MFFTFQLQNTDTSNKKKCVCECHCSKIHVQLSFSQIISGINTCTRGIVPMLHSFLDLSYNKKIKMKLE
jgi:hypothetical protein